MDRGTSLINANTRKLLSLTIVFVVLFSGFFVLKVHALPISGKVRIMPLGDSITVGYPELNGYRTPLYQDLIDHNFNVNFVGSQNNGTGLGQ